MFRWTLASTFLSKSLARLWFIECTPPEMCALRGFGQFALWVLGSIPRDSIRSLRGTSASAGAAEQLWISLSLLLSWFSLRCQALHLHSCSVSSSLSLFLCSPVSLWADGWAGSCCSKLHFCSALEKTFCLEAEAARGRKPSKTLSPFQPAGVGEHLLLRAQILGNFIFFYNV